MSPSTHHPHTHSHTHQACRLMALTPVHSISLCPLLSLSRCHFFVLVKCLLSFLISLRLLHRRISSLSQPPHAFLFRFSISFLHYFSISSLPHFSFVFSLFLPLSPCRTWSACCIYMRDVTKCWTQHNQNQASRESSLYSVDRKAGTQERREGWGWCWREAINSDIISEGSGN